MFGLVGVHKSLFFQSKDFVKSSSVFQNVTHNNRAPLALRPTKDTAGMFLDGSTLDRNAFFRILDS